MESTELVKALVVPFAAGFVVQRVVEILDTYTTAKLSNTNLKKFAIGILSLCLGWVLAFYGDIRIFGALNWPMDAHLDAFTSGIFISGGSEGFNSLLKFANYKKEASKADAADKLDKLNSAAPKAIQAVNPQAAKP